MVTPYWPSANGEVERFNRTLGRAIKCAHVDGTNWKVELEKFLFQYRTTPHTITGFAPAAVMFNYTCKNDLPSLPRFTNTKMDKEINRHDALRKMQSKNYTDAKRNAKEINFEEGDTVLVKDVRPQNKLSPFYEKVPYTITKVYQRSVKIANRKGSFVRIKSHLKCFTGSTDRYHQEQHITEPNPQPLPIHVKFIFIAPDAAVINDESDDDETIPYRGSSDEDELEDIEDLENQNRPKRTITKLVRFRDEIK